jgi:hypothetical protein
MHARALLISGRVENVQLKEMKEMKRSLVASMLLMLFAVHSAFAAHPLVTDDAGTVGTGKVQIEITGEFGFDRKSVPAEFGSTGEKTRSGQAAVTTTVGLRSNIDLVLGAPYQWYSVCQDGERIGRADGLSDISLDLKWRVFEQDGWSFALKPGITLPTGDDDRGLGSGRATYRMYLVGTREVAPWAFHANLGYVRNENPFGDRKDLWHASAAAELEVIKNLKAVANVGIERNPDPSSNTNPAFALAGLIWQINDTFSVDGGVKFGLNRPETDTTYLFGVTMKF